MMRFLLAVLAFVLLLPLQAEARKWNVDIVKSPIMFSGKQMGVAFNGTFPVYYTDIDFDPKDPREGHMRVTIEMASAQTGDKQRDSALPQKEWFDVKAWPQAEFVALDITKASDDSFVASGSLTIKGNIRPAKLPFKLVRDKDVLRLQGTLTINRHDFHVGEGEWVADNIVGPDIRVNVDVILY